MKKNRKLTKIIIIPIFVVMISTAFQSYLTDAIEEPSLKTSINVRREMTAENSVKKTRSDEEMRQLSNNFGQIRGGFSTYGFIDVDESNGHVFYHNSYRESTVYRYTSLANFINNNGVRQFNLPRQSEGTYHTIYNNHLYYAQYNSNTLVKCRTTDMAQVLSRALPNAGFHNRAHFNWGGYTDINLMSDETGLYVCWATSTSQPMQLSQLDENLNVLKTWNTGRNKGNVGWAFMVGGVLYWGNSYNSATFNYKYDTSTSSRSSYSNSLGAGGYIAHTSYNAEDNSLLVWNQGNVYHYPEIGGVRITNVESAALKGDIDDGKVCYAEYSSYNLSVNITTTKTLDDASEMEVWLDYNTTNATLGFNWTQRKFFKLGDENGYVQLLVKDSAFSNNGDDKWFVNFSIRFNFTFPHEKKIDCFVKIRASNGKSRMKRFPHICRVENDFEFKGTPFFFGDEQGKIESGSWVKGNQAITVSNITVIYAGSPMRYPDDEFFNVRIMDRTGKTWWDNSSSVEGISISINTQKVTDPAEEYLITIENIPGSGICMTNLSFPVKIDAEAPLFPVNLKCRAGGFKDKETENTNQAEMYVTWDEVEDPASGLLGYYYSHLDNSGTTNGTFTNETEVKIDELGEGFAEIYVWSIDNVGNIGEAGNSGILVDLTLPVFSNHTPLDGSWRNHTDIECMVEIYDGTGSGVDVTTIEYSVSNDGVHGFDFWLPAWVPLENEPTVASVKYIFEESEENYIKWRVKDVSGNGFAESPSINIKIDTIPVIFADAISPPKDWYDHHSIRTKITVSDTGSGLDPQSFETRISTSGPNDFSTWMQIDRENITKFGDDGYEIAVTFTYPEGKDNYIMFRGTDMVGNPFTSSDKFNLKIDTSPVYFGDFTPDENDFADRKSVECFIQILDDGSGVDPQTVEYSVAKGGGGNESFGPWKKAVNVVEGNPTQVLMELEFEWGSDNFIRWRANDVMGTGYNVSLPYRVWVNSKPDAEISSPEAGSYYRYDGEITFDASDSSDEDGDNLTYYWTSNVSANQLLGVGSVKYAVLAPGKHTITVFVSDGNGYNESAKVKIEVGSKAAYERDSDGDGFSDGLEREKGTDPHNGAVSPEGEPDIVVQEKLGILSEGSSLLFVVLGGLLLLIILILVIFFVVRKRKKDEEPSVQSPPLQSQYGPSQHPYGQGQYMSEAGQQGYGEMAQYQAAVMAMQGLNTPTMMMNSGSGMGASQQFGTAAPGQTPTLQLQPQIPYGQLGTGAAGSTTYSLPQFSTEQGSQNLNRMALPPGPIHAEAQTNINPIQPETISPSVDEQQFPFGQQLISPPAPAATGPSSIIDPTNANTGDLGELDAYLATIGSLKEESDIREPPVPMETPAQAANEITMNRQQTGLLASSSETQESASPSLPPPNSGGNRSGFQQIQCHSCSNNYTAEIVQLPALVTCPVCQTQGMIESM